MWWYPQQTRHQPPAKGAETWGDMLIYEEERDIMNDILPEMGQEQTDLDYNGGLPPYEENK